jgi:hypothetical protein
MLSFFSGEGTALPIYLILTAKHGVEDRYCALKKRLLKELRKHKVLLLKKRKSHKIKN